MAEIKSRIQLKHDTEAHWQLATGFTPKAGEMIIYDADANNPVRYKIGDGTTKVNTLPFATGTAILYAEQNINEDQQKQALINLGLSTEDIEGLKVIEAVTADTANKVAKKLTAGNKTYDGSADISIDKNDVGLGNVTNESKATMFTSPAFTGIPTAPTAENTVDNTQVATTAFVHNVVDALSAADLGLEQAMKFLGTTTTDISDASNIDTVIIGSGTVKVEAGNVVLYNGYEYVWTGSAWEQLGQEGSFALKSIAITAGAGLTGGGDLNANITINVGQGGGILVEADKVSHADTSSVTNVTAADRTYVKSLTFDDFGHVTDVTTGTETVTDTTYNEATTSAAGLMSAADKTFVDGAQAQIDGKMNSVDPVGSGSFSFGRKADTTVGENSIAFGSDVEASNKWSYAEGRNTVASGGCSHAEGYTTTASGHYSHAEGYTTTASDEYSHAEGHYTIASGKSSHAEGSGTIASRDYSHAEGLATKSEGYSQHVQGIANVGVTEDLNMVHMLHIVGNGEANWNDNTQSYDIVPSNAHTLDLYGNAWFAGDVYVGSTSGTNKDDGSRVLTSVSIVRW